MSRNGSKECKYYHTHRIQGAQGLLPRRAFSTRCISSSTRVNRRKSRPQKPLPTKVMCAITENLEIYGRQGLTSNHSISSIKHCKKLHLSASHGTSHQAHQAQSQNSICSQKSIITYMYQFQEGRYNSI